jgi:AcrR family transcriptional regulator
MPRAGLSTARVVDEASAHADEVGLDNLTLAAVAKRLGVRLPSLYKHVEGMPALQQELTIRAKVEMTRVFARATVGKSRGDALRALATAYLDWARQHPGRYAASVRAPRTDDPEDQAVSSAAFDVVIDALSGYDLDEVTAVDAVRTLRAALDGFINLEAVGGFGMDRPLDQSIVWMLDTLDAALTASSGRVDYSGRPATTT